MTDASPGDVLTTASQRSVPATAGQGARRCVCRRQCGATLALLLLLAGLLSGCLPGELLTPPPTPEPLVPTAPPPVAFFAPTSTLTPSAQPTTTPFVTPATGVISPTLTVPVGATATVTVSVPAPVPALPADWRQRIGIGVTNGSFEQYTWGEALPGWYLDWKIHLTPAHAPGVEFAQMVRLKQGEPLNALADVKRVAQANPGSLWLIGNEPDVAWQDNSTPAQYVAAYHDLYRLLKTSDPTARVAIGGISQVTPLRLRYLQEIWDLYRARYGEEMPVDVWNVHTFVLREEKGSWGVGLPPGFEAATDGTLWDISEHNRLDLVHQQVVTFRQWMAAHGQREKPLVVSEYGILMPADYGFPPEVVAAYLTASFTYFATTSDAQIGYAADDNRLVQRWCWYSTSDDIYPTGNLFALPNLTPTAIFRAYKAYLAGTR
ncbi:MAG: glycosyl hydrolase [Anaerolineae bacterium]